MPSNRRKNGLTAATLAVVACAFAWPAPAVSEPAATQPATVPAATPSVGPIAYYVASCARCHGDVSAAYVGLDKPKRGKELEQIIDDMAVGPAQAPLDTDGLKHQTALHEAMFGKTPFVWLDPAAKDRVAGEVLPGTTITFQPDGGQPTTPTITDNGFDFPKQPGTLLAKRGERTLKISVR